MPQKNDDSIKKLGDKLKEMAAKAASERKSLKPTDHAPTIKELVEEGSRLCEKDEKNYPSKPTAVDKKSSDKPANPYLLARLSVLKKYQEWRRREIAEMEKTGNLDNPHYDAFVKEVAAEGDKLSS